MTTQPTPAPEGAMTEWLLRAFAVMAYAFGVARLGYAFTLDTTRITLLILLLTEGYTLMLVLFARRASLRDLSPLAMAATFVAMFFFVAIDPTGTHKLIPELAGVALQVVGTAWQFAAKITLGRSFGLLPAQRGLVLAGPYRVVRHPIYLGYFIAHVGFVLVNFSWINVGVFALLLVAQVIRIQREEKVLAHDDAYRAYQQRVRWRLLPFVY